LSDKNNSSNKSPSLFNQKNNNSNNSNNTTNLNNSKTTTITTAVTTTHHPAPAQPTPQANNDTISRPPKLQKKPVTEWRKSVSAPVPEDHHSECNVSDSDSENHKSRPSNETEEDDDFDDGIDNATYDERMSRLSLNELNNSRVSDSHCEENDHGENTLTPSPEINNNPPASDSSITQKSHSSSLYQEFNFDPNDLQAFADWLRLRFTDLLLDNSYDKNLPMNFSASPIPLLWNTPYVFLGNSLTTRSRFDFARHDDPEITKTSPRKLFNVF